MVNPKSETPQALGCVGRMPIVQVQKIWTIVTLVMSQSYMRRRYHCSTCPKGETDRPPV